MRKQSPLVSVILPAYNAEQFIADTLNSILAQTYTEFEVLVVDDGSRDCTAAIIETFARQDSRIRFFRQTNQGVAAARNLAIDHAHGEYIAPIDADDIWYPAKLQKQVACLEEAGPKAGVSYVWCVSIDDKSRFIGLGPKCDLEGEVYEPLVLRNFIGNASVPLFRRSCLRQVGGYNTDLRLQNAQGCEDWELCLRLAEICEFRVVKEYLAAYRCYNLSMSYDHATMAKSYALVLRDVQRRHPDIPPRLYRWSKGIFYLYLAGKSNACGDLRTSFKWLLRALQVDRSVLLLGWVNAGLIKGALRMVASPLANLVWRDNRAWRRIGPPWNSEKAVEMTHEEIMAAGRDALPPRRLWDRVQIHRWAIVTNHRSFAC